MSTHSLIGGSRRGYESGQSHLSALGPQWDIVRLGRLTGLHTRHDTGQRLHIGSPQPAGPTRGSGLPWQAPPARPGLGPAQESANPPRQAGRCRRPARLAPVSLTCLRRLRAWPSPPASPSPVGQSWGGSILDHAKEPGAQVSISPATTMHWVEEAGPPNPGVQSPRQWGWDTCGCYVFSPFHSSRHLSDLA